MRKACGWILGVLVVVAPFLMAGGWADIATNLLGIRLDPTTVPHPNNGDVISYDSTSKAYKAVAGAGGATGPTGPAGATGATGATGPAGSGGGGSGTTLNVTLNNATTFSTTVTQLRINQGDAISVTGGISAGTTFDVTTTFVIPNQDDYTIPYYLSGSWQRLAHGSAKTFLVTNASSAVGYSTLNDMGYIAAASKTGTGTKLVLDVGATIGTPTISDYVTLTDQGGAAGAAGRLQRNGPDLSWGSSGTPRNVILDNDARLTNKRAPTVTSETTNDIMRFNGSDWVRLALGSNSTVLSVSSGGTLGYAQVTNAMIIAAAGIPYSKLTLTATLLVADHAASALTGTGTKLVTDVAPIIDSPDIKTKLVLWDSTQTNGVTQTVVGPNALQLAGPSNKVTLTVSAANTMDFDHGALKFDSATPSSASVLTLNTPTFVFGSDAQYDLMMRGASNYARLGKGSNSTVLSVSSGGVVGYATVTSAMITDGTITDADVAAANKDGATGTASMRTLGTGSAQAFPGNGAIDTLGAATDITTLNGTTSAHGLMPKGSNSAFTFYNSQLGQTLPGGKMRIQLNPGSCQITGATADPLPVMVAGTNITYGLLQYLDAKTTDGRWPITGAATKDYAGGPITVHIWYKSVDTTNTHNTFWAVSMLSRGDDDVLDTAYSTAHTFTRLCKSTASHINDGSVGFTPTSGEMTAGKNCNVQIERQGSNGSDTNTNEDDVIGVTVSED